MPNDRIDKVEIINDWIWQSQRIAHIQVSPGECVIPETCDQAPGKKKRQSLVVSGMLLTPTSAQLIFAAVRVLHEWVSTRRNSF